jgi:Tfp pilus assembly protein PilN
MIKINLSTAQKQVDISNIGGFDFTKVKPLWLGLSILFMYVPDFTVVPMWEEEFNNRTTDLTTLQGRLSSLKRKVTQSAQLEKQIRELKAQEENLMKKLTAVKQAISEKRNPSNLLIYISKNIPSDLWLLDLSIDSNLMIIKGEALNYGSVGTFLSNLRSSVFIKDASIKSTTSEVRASDKKRIEKFEVHFSLARLE